MQRTPRWITLGVVGATLGLALALPPAAEAKRIGGGRPAGMQRSVPPKAPPQTPPAQQAPVQGAQPTAPMAAPAAGAGAAAAAAAAKPKRNWLGPLAGLAAGFGLAALFSHLGMGAGFANFLSMLLMAVAVFFVVRWLIRRFAGGAAAARQPAYAGAAAGAAGVPAAAGGFAAPSAPLQRAELAPAPLSTPSAHGLATPQAAPAVGAVADTPVTALPGGMDAAEFVRLAKMVFIRMQAANDAGDAEDLRRFTTPELFASLKLDLQERAGAAQHTDVVKLDADVVDVAREGAQDVVSVRFSGLVREARDLPAEKFDELWHLVRPANGEWLIAGITPLTTA